MDQYDADQLIFLHNDADSDEVSPSPPPPRQRIRFDADSNQHASILSYAAYNDDQKNIGASLLGSASGNGGGAARQRIPQARVVNSQGERRFDERRRRRRQVGGDGPYVMMGVRVSQETFYVFLALGSLVIIGLMVWMLATKQTILEKEARRREPPTARPTPSPTAPLVELPAICDTFNRSEISDIEWYNQLAPDFDIAHTDFTMCNQTLQSGATNRCDEEGRIVALESTSALIVDYPDALFCLDQLRVFNVTQGITIVLHDLDLRFLLFEHLEVLLLEEFELVVPQLPPELSRLSETLRHLEVRSSEMAGTIPSEYGSLRKLETLALQSFATFPDTLSGTIPTTLGKLVNLRTLDLHDNTLEQRIPRQLGNLEWLEVLDLSENQLSGSVPRQLARLQRLEDLRLHTNQLSGSLHELEPLKISRTCRLRRASGGSEQNCFECPLPAELERKCSLDSTFDLTRNCAPSPCP